MAHKFDQQLFSLDEYLKLERQSLDKHEFYQGRIYLMAGGSPNHSLIAANLITELSSALRERPCRVFNSDLQIHVPAHGLITYPDASVVCGPLQTTPGRTDLIINPQLIVEVLSPSTADYDHNTKFQLYKALESLEEYLLVHSRSVSVYYYRKLGANEWVQQVYSQPDEIIELDKLVVQLPLALVYAKVEFEPGSQQLR